MTRTRQLAAPVPGGIRYSARRVAVWLVRASIPALRRSGGNAGSRSHFGCEISRDFQAGADFDNDGSCPAHRVFSSKDAVSSRGAPGKDSRLAVPPPGVIPLVGPANGREQQSFAAATKLFSQSRGNGVIRRRQAHQRPVSCDFPLPIWPCRRFRTIPAGQSSGGTPSQSWPMTR